MAKASELKDKFQRTAAGEGRAPATQNPTSSVGSAPVVPATPAPAVAASGPAAAPRAATQLRPAPEPQSVAEPVAMPEPARHPKQSVRITADIDKDLHRALKQFCLDHDCNGQDVVRYLLHLSLVADAELRSAVAQYVSRAS